MSLYLDSAALEDVRCAQALGFVTGTTTNPALIARTRRPGLEVLKDILDASSGPVFYQVTAEAREACQAQAHEAAALAPERVIVKIPATTQMIGLAAHLTRAGLHCCVTAVSSPAQAYLAALAGADYAAVYVNRLTRQMSGEPDGGLGVLKACLLATRETPTRVIAASLKSVEEVSAVILAGAHDITIPLELILRLGDHPLSQQAIDDFAAAQKL